MVTVLYSTPAHPPNTTIITAPLYIALLTHRQLNLEAQFVRR
eukprot:SAG11_NODE_26596_length_343_cov_0.729508_1_plen_41_part_01